MSKEINQKHLKSQIEIADLIAEAVDHASARRNQVLDTQESLSELSEQEEKAINGGLSFRIILGYFPVDINIA